jgi:hypothetical protein
VISEPIEDSYPLMPQQGMLRIVYDPTLGLVRGDSRRRP